MKLTKVVDIKAGKELQGFFLCREKNMRHTRAGDLYLDLVLRLPRAALVGLLAGSTEGMTMEGDAGVLERLPDELLPDTAATVPGFLFGGRLTVLGLGRVERPTAELRGRWRVGLRWR